MRGSSTHTQFHSSAHHNRIVSPAKIDTFDTNPSKWRVPQSCGKQHLKEEYMKADEDEASSAPLKSASFQRAEFISILECKNR